MSGTLYINSGIIFLQNNITICINSAPWLQYAPVRNLLMGTVNMISESDI